MEQKKLADGKLSCAEREGEKSCSIALCIYYSKECQSLERQRKKKGLWKEMIGMYDRGVNGDLRNGGDY